MGFAIVGFVMCCKLASMQNVGDKLGSKFVFKLTKSKVSKMKRYVQMVVWNQQELLQNQVVSKMQQQAALHQ